MSLARVFCCLAMAGGAVWFSAASAIAEAPSAASEQPQAADADPGHGGASADPLSVDPDLAIWTFVVFIVLLAVLKKFAWGPILQALESREHGIAEHIAQAEKAHQQAREMLAEHDRKLAGTADEVRAILEEARRDAEQTKQQILVEARAAAEVERARALRDIEAATDAALKSLAERSADLAVELAGKIVRSKLSADDHARLIQEAMAKFPRTSPSKN